MSETVHIAIPAVGEQYRFFAEVTAESARRSSSLPIDVHYVDWDGMTPDLRDRIRRLGDWHGSAITWSRLWLPELFPQLDWIVSADADILFRGDIAALWRLRPSGSDGNADAAPWILPSRDCPMPGQPYNRVAVSWYQAHGLELKNPETYFCAGLALFNLKAMREGGWAEMRDAFLAAHEASAMPNADQCVLNYLLRDKKVLLPRGWGVFSGDANADIDWSRPGAVHFVEDMPWKRTKVTQLESDLVVEWKRLANELGGHYGWHNWRRLAFLFLKYNQWVLKLHPKLRLHLRSTRGVRT